MNSVNIVIDTNILVSALRSNRGASHRLLMLLGKDIFTPNVSVPLFLEYESVLKRMGLIGHLSESDIDDILNYLLSQSKIRQIYFLWRPLLKDPKDDLVLEVAVSSNSSYIVTHNVKDFREANRFGIQVVGPKEFLMKVGMLS